MVLIRWALNGKIRDYKNMGFVSRSNLKKNVIIGNILYVYLLADKEGDRSTVLSTFTPTLKNILLLPAISKWGQEIKNINQEIIPINDVLPPESMKILNIAGDKLISEDKQTIKLALKSLPSNNDATPLYIYLLTDNEGDRSKVLPNLTPALKNILSLPAVSKWTQEIKNIIPQKPNIVTEESTIVPVGSSIGLYIGIAIGILVLLIILYFIFGSSSKTLPDKLSDEESE